MLAADLNLIRDSSFSLHVQLEVSDGETVGVIGENGSGKSTVIELLAGLLQLHSGSIQLNTQVFDEPSKQLWVPPEHRRVGYLPQDVLLLEHLNVVDNIALGLRAAPRYSGHSRRELRAFVSHELAAFGLAGFEDRLPSELSGGQAQRVGLARALLREPALLLLDEPLAAVDGNTKAELRSEINHRVRRLGCVTVIVSHEPADVLALCDQLLILRAGSVFQSGSVHEVKSSPRDNYVASLLGLI